ncbi:M48 family metalloprotease [Nocardioides sp. LHD-245]|uniref:M48 family metalloprotease n=1 Tax=Nocardioides sp. LHD-245 TaxID=3051387 RepID=UPI0027E1677D|nr:M48 family metalloprotease [Nocardioides sp. LHD-245]
MAAPSAFAQRLDARVAQALDNRLVERVGSGSRRRAARALAAVLVTPVHLLSVVLAVTGILLLVRGDGWWQWLMAAFVLGVAWVTRPDVLGRAEPDTVLVAPPTAPALTDLVAEVAALLGTRPPSEIRVDPHLNAYVAPRGLRNRQLVLGAPLWVALSPQARVALLGHELGHLAHGDLLSGQYVGSGYRTLHRWVELLDPVGSEVFENSTPVLVQAVMAPPRWIVNGYLRLLVAVNAAASRSQELYADLASAVVAGTEGAVGCLETSLLADSVGSAAQRAALDGRRPDLGEAIAARVATIDAEQRAAARRDAAEDRRSIDDSHPPTADRLRLIESVEPAPAGIVVDSARNGRIDRELAPGLQQAFKRLGDAYRYVG